MVNQLTTCADSTLDFTRGERIVAIGIDESECSQYALNWAMENLSTKADQILLLNVRPGTRPPDDPMFRDFGDYLVIADQREQSLSLEILKDATEKLEKKGFFVRAVALRGEKEEELVRKCNELRVNTLILGKCKRKSWNLFYTDVGKYCSKRCTMPVIVIDKKKHPLSI